MIRSSGPRHQQVNARVRGIPFLMTFDQWWSIWERSGHWHKRGRKRGQYVMARYGDRGGYEVGNVRIVTVRENHAERQFRRQKSVPKLRAKLSVASKKRMAHPAQRTKISIALLRYHAGEARA